MHDRAGEGLRVAVVGCGSIGTRHIRNLRSLGAAVTPVEIDPDRRRAAAEELGGFIEASVDRALGGRPDAVVVATSTPAHVAIASAAIDHGCALFVEKPLAASRDGLDALCARAEARNLVTMVACNMRFHPGPATVRRLLDEGAAGRVVSARIETGSYLPRWRPGTDYRLSYSASSEGGGALLDCIHEVDLAIWFFGPGRLAGCARRAASAIGLDTDGLAELLVEHHSGVLSSIHVNFIQRNYHRRCYAVGTEGTVYWDVNSGDVVLHGPDGQVAARVAQPADWNVNRMYEEEIAHFADAVRLGSATINTMRASLAALDVVLQARAAETTA